jgi:hypothetical protein
VGGRRLPPGRRWCLRDIRFSTATASRVDLHPGCEPKRGSGDSNPAVARQYTGCYNAATMRTALPPRPAGLRSLAALPLLTFVALALACLIPPATASAAPTITGTDEDVWNTARPVPAYVITRTAPGTQIWWEVAGVSSGMGRSPVTVRLPGLGDGSYRLVASEGEGSGQATAERLFRVDLTPPIIAIRQPARGARLDQGATVPADYGCEGAISCAGDVAPGVLLDTSRLGPASFTVRAADDAGNVAISVVEYEIRPAGIVTPAGSGPPAAGVPSPSAPVTLNARRLRPRAGAVLTSKRPVLRWPARRAAHLYNLQIFRLRGASITKVVSAFPRLNRFRVPARRLAFGDRYVWRVWPFLARGHTVRPLGVSFFDVRRRRVD